MISAFCGRYEVALKVVVESCDKSVGRIMGGAWHVISASMSMPPPPPVVCEP